MKKKRIFILFIICLILIAILLLGIGFYFSELSKSSHIVGSIIDEIESSTSYYLYPEEDVFIGDDFTIDGNIQLDLDTEYYKNKANNDEEAKKTYHWIRNLDQLEDHFLIKQKASTQEAFLEFEAKIKEDNLVHQKVLIQNATEYYFIKDIVKNYINNGNCNYFESINEETTTIDNLDYLYSFFFDSLKKSLKDEYFDGYERVEKIQGNEQRVYMISIKLDDKMIHSILEDILKSFQENERAKKILGNIYPDYQKWKIEKEKTFLDKGESYTISIYTSRLFYKPLKYEVVHLFGEEKESFFFEGDTEKGEAYYIKNDQLKNQFVFEKKENSYQLDIQDAFGKSIGEARVEKDKWNRTFTYAFENDNKKYDFIYSSKYSDVKKKKGFKNTKKMSFKFVEDKVNHFSGDIVLQMNAENIVKIDEDVSTATLDSMLGNEEKEKIDKKWESIKNRMEN